MSNGANSLSGLRILVVEDELLVAMMIEDMLQTLGCDVVGPAATLEDALAAVEEQHFDAALLDANLRGQDSSPIAEALVERHIPFLLATGYGASCASGTALDDAPRLRKPFGLGELAERMTAVFADAGAND
jgi:DNA-binding response OmpR family regulator